MNRIIHQPVLQKEILEYLDPKPNENFIDATVGQGGHTSRILERNKPKGKVLGIDWDSKIIKELKFQASSFKFQERLILINDSYTNLEEVVKKYKFGPVHGILFDLGLSSWHLEKSGRGFSFMRNEPLDMRYGIETKDSKRKAQNYLTAEKIVNEYSEEEIEKILREYGEERFARRIAEAIVNERKIRPTKTTFQLIEVIKKAIPLKYRQGRIHFATRTFQALRIAVNDELNNLKKVLPQTIEVLAPKGRIVVISFHSLEDRIVKEFFKSCKEREQCLKILTKKPIRPEQKEIKFNPRSRSAKLRAAMKHD